jgi:GNAT superfamily N-acetyltransferase
MQTMVSLEAGVFSITSLTPGDCRLPNLLTACHDYFSRHYGGVPAAGALATLMALPAGSPEQDLTLFGLCDTSDRLIGLIVLLRRWGTRRRWCIRTLLVHPDHRNLGHGRAAYLALAAWSKRQGAASILIGVLAANMQALRFWKRLGFVEATRETVPGLSGELIHLEHRFCPIPLTGLVPLGQTLGRQTTSAYALAGPAPHARPRPKPMVIGAMPLPR